MIPEVASVLIPIVGAGMVGGIMAAGYVKAPPDKAFIISGLRKNPKVLVGKAGIKIPFLERKDELNLQLIQIDVRTSSAVPTADYININVDAVVNVKINNNEQSVGLAAQNFLNRPPEYIAKVAEEVLEGSMREIVGKMSLQDMVSNRQKFADYVREDAAPDLEKMGLTIVSFNVQNFTDDQGVIENLGVDNIAQISKNAAIAKANAEKEMAVARAQAEKESNDARIKAEAEIAKKENELAIQRAELKKQSDIKKAEADSAYEIQKQEQRKTVETTTANANLARMEKEIELKEREVAITERALEAEIKKKAEAEKYAAEQEADAALYEVQKQSEAELFERQKKAEAEKFEAEQRAEAEKARSEAARVAMENEAAGIAAKGRAEAEAIQAKAEAEAAGILKKAEAMKEYGEAATQQMMLDTLKVYFEQLPNVASAIAKPMESIDNITIYEGGTSSLTGNVTTTMKQITDGVKDATGFDPMALLAGMLGGSLSNN
jgi:flotillin